ncbi:MAG: hypothetical protein NVS9B10_10530 [Nevskia sp.]
MAGTRITLHLPSYRSRALSLQAPGREAEAAYDAHIGRYVAYLEDEARKAGHVVSTDRRDDGPAYSIEAADHAQKTAAHDWLAALPDIWNWIP